MLKDLSELLGLFSGLYALRQVWNHGHHRDAAWVIILCVLFVLGRSVWRPY